MRYMHAFTAVPSCTESRIFVLAPSVQSFKVINYVAMLKHALNTY